MYGIDNYSISKKFQGFTIIAHEWSLKTKCSLQIGEHQQITWVWDKVQAQDERSFPGFDYKANRKRALAQALLLFFPPEEPNYSKTLEHKRIRTHVWKTIVSQYGFHLFSDTQVTKLEREVARLRKRLGDFEPAS